MIAILGFILVGLGGYLLYHIRTQIGNDTSISKKTKSELLRESNDFISDLRNLKDEWRALAIENQRTRDSVEAKYSENVELQTKKLNDLSLKESQSHALMLRRYEEKIKPEAKRIKYEHENYLGIYKKSQVSFAKYDRIDRNNGLSEIIDDLDFLKTKVQATEE